MARWWSASRRSRCCGNVAREAAGRAPAGATNRRMAMDDRRMWHTIAYAVAIVLAGWLIGRGIERCRSAARAVSGKGVAELTLGSDIGLWPLRIVSANDDLD